MGCRLFLFACHILVWHVVFDLAKVRFKEQAKSLDAYHWVMRVVVVRVRVMFVLMSMRVCSNSH